MCKTEEDEGPSTEEDSQCFHGDGVCKWFNVRMGFGFLSMNSREGQQLDEPVDVFVHQVGLCFQLLSATVNATVSVALMKLYLYCTNLSIPTRKSASTCNQTNLFHH